MFFLPTPILAGKKGVVLPVEFVGRTDWFQQNTTGNIAVTLPGGVQEGDLLIAVGASGASAGTTTCTGPSTTGWTSLGELSNTGDCFHAFYKFAGPSEANFTMQFSGGSFTVYREATVYAFRNVVALSLEENPIDLSVNSVSTSWTDPAAGSVELIVGSASYSGSPDEITGFTVSGGGWDHDEYDNTAGAASGVMWSSYRSSTAFGTVSYFVSFNNIFTYAMWNRLRLYSALPATVGGPPSFIAAGSFQQATGGGFSGSIPGSYQDGDLIVVVASSAHQGGAQPPLATVTATGMTFTDHQSNVVTNNARSTLSFHSGTWNTGNSSTINISWGTNNLDFRGAVILVYRPTGTIFVTDEGPAILSTTSGSSQDCGNFFDQEGVRVLAWMTNATSTSNTSPSGVPANCVNRGLAEGSSVGQPDKDLVVHDLVEANRGAFNVLTQNWTQTMTEGLCGGIRLNDDGV